MVLEAAKQGCSGSYHEKYPGTEPGTQGTARLTWVPGAYLPKVASTNLPAVGAASSPCFAPQRCLDQSPSISGNIPSAPFLYGTDARPGLPSSSQLPAVRSSKFVLDGGSQLPRSLFPSLGEIFRGPCPGLPLDREAAPPHIDQAIFSRDRDFFPR